MTNTAWSDAVRWSCDRIVGRSDRPVSGCTSAEIAALQKRLRARLPGAYAEFLSIAGKSTGDFLLGTHIAFDKLDFLQGNIVRVMAESGAKLPDGGFCFASNPSYVFLWFRTDQGDDPPVSLFEEGWTESKEALPAFSAWLEASVSDQWGVRRSPDRPKPR